MSDERPVCPDRRCARVMIPVGDAVYECPHAHGSQRVVERSLPRHPDIPRDDSLAGRVAPRPRSALSVHLPSLAGHAAYLTPSTQRREQPKLTRHSWDSGLVLCLDCRRRMRPSTKRKTASPGTVMHAAGGRCVSCYRRHRKEAGQ